MVFSFGSFLFCRLAEQVIVAAVTEPAGIAVIGFVVVDTLAASLAGDVVVIVLEVGVVIDELIKGRTEERSGFDGIDEGTFLLVSEPSP